MTEFKPFAPINFPKPEPDKHILSTEPEPVEVKEKLSQGVIDAQTAAENHHSKTHPAAPVFHEPPVLTKEESTKKEKVLAIVAELAEILADHGGESNVPVNHKYWGLLKILRALH